jgi:hypothetical protein
MTNARNLYTDEERVTAFLKRALTEDEILLLPDSLEHVTNVIKGYTHRNWSDDTTIADTDHYFDGTGNKQLYVDDFTSLTAINFSDSMGDSMLTFTDPKEWLLYPLNSQPKQSVYLRNYSFYYGSGNVKLTGKFTSGLIPPDIKKVATSLVSKYLDNLGAPPGGMKSESIEGYSYTLFTAGEKSETDQNLLSTLDKWKKVTF